MKQASRILPESSASRGVEFHDGDQAEILEGIQSARYELALTFDLQPLDDFDVVELGQIPPHAVLAEGRPLARQSAVSLRELAPEPLILMDMPHSREYLLSLFQQLQVRPNLRYLPASFETVRALAGNGLGYGLLNLVPRSGVTYDGSMVRSLPLIEPVRALRLAIVRLRRCPCDG